MNCVYLFRYMYTYIHSMFVFAFDILIYIVMNEGWIGVVI